MDRPTLRKIVLIQDFSDQMIRAICAAAPDASIVTATEQEDIDREIVDAQVTIGGKLTDEHLHSANELVWHHVPWVGVENSMSPVYSEKGIVLTNGSGVNSANIAEHVLAMMLVFARQIPHFVRGQNQAIWHDYEDNPTFFELGGQRVVCLGTGDIGEEVARRLHAFGCELVGASRSGRDVSGFDRCVTFEHLDEELAEADHVVNSLPLTDATRRIVSRERIGSIKPGAYFYNVGRGRTVDQDALIEALDEGRLAGAGLDVTDPEPLPADSPLWAMKNVIITGHTSGISSKAQQRMADFTVTQLLRYQRGEDLLNVVDFSAGY